jgi:ligand-binding sensor domain-containing protein/signal transduction histidine kinase
MSRFLLLLFSVAVALAEQLPMVVLSARDGLPAGTVLRILADSKGFLWVPHADGLTRYDGNGFRSFTRADGLPSDRVSTIVERANSTYWVAAREHLCLFDPRAGRSRFQCESPKLGEIDAILEENEVLWLGTDRGLWQRKDRRSWTSVSSVKPSAPMRSTAVRRLIKDKRGDVWAATQSGLFRFRKSGQVDQWTTTQGLCDDYITTVNETPGAIWAGTQTDLFRFEVQQDSGDARIAGRYGVRHGLPSGYTNDVRYWRGSVWAATFQGLARLSPSGRWQMVEVDNAIRNLPLNALAIDSQDALWMGTDGGGLARLAGSGFSTFTETDGLPIRKVWSVMEDRKGDLMVITKDEQDYAINRFDGSRFQPTRLSNPFGSMFGWSWSQIAVHSGSGSWWLATSDGLLRYDRGLVSIPSRLGSGVGLPHNNVSRVLEEKNGAMWVSVYELGSIGLYRRDPGAQHFRKFNESDGLPRAPEAGTPVSSFVEDHHGQLWLGLLRGGLLRYRNGRFEQFIGRVPGAPDQGVRALLVDRRGRLWIGTAGKGLLRVDNPLAETPVFVAYNRSNGLSDNLIHAVTDDLKGRIYAAGAGTVDRVDLERQPGAQLRRYTTADGVISGILRVAFRDRHGALWFGGDQGLSRILPAEDQRIESPVLIHSISVNGQRQPLSDLGETEPASLSLKDFERQLLVEFGGFRHDLRYQTRLLGVDRDWSAPSSNRNVHYLSLAPNSYELQIRGVSPDGSVSAKEARFRFSIAAPVWQQWWFLALAAATVIGISFWTHRFLLERRLVVERIRARIATDLHDDIGASLSRIAVMSEALQTRSDGADVDSRRTLAQIAEESRGMVEDMGDIVWSIDPRRDTMSDFVARLRAFGSDVLEPHGIRWAFDAPEDVLRYRLSPDQRRQLYLILKEAIHNVARHSRATSARLSIRLEEGSLRAEIEDDGCGYVPDGARLGVHSMRTRAVQLSGAFDVAARPEGGTRVSLRFPLAVRNA